MKIFSRIFYALGFYLVIMTVVYFWAVTHIEDAGYLPPEVEWGGGVALLLSAVMALMLGGYFHFTEVRQDVVPEDWEDAEIADAAGNYGWFSPTSIWPIAMSGAILVLGLGVIYWQYWLIVLGAVLLIFTTTKLNLQYGQPKQRH